MEEIEAEGPNGHWQGMTLFLYYPQTHQWSQSFVNSKNGVLSTPTIGAFKDGRGELFASYSNDGGRTWAPAFIATLTRKP